MEDWLEFSIGIGLALTAGLFAFIAEMAVWTMLNPDNPAIRVARYYLG